jgi:shikimate kinase
MKQKTNIILIGMPAVGKSTVGRILADTLNLSFLDTDDWIREKEGTDLDAIIRERGLDGFCRCEEANVLAITAERTVISTGGSVVYGSAAMDHLKENGLVIYLNADLRLLMTRLEDPEKRGVVRKPGQTFESLLEERDRLYRLYADLVVDCPPGDIPEVTAARVLKMLP